MLLMALAVDSSLLPSYQLPVTSYGFIHLSSAFAGQANGHRK
jgi:hypothetical protein